MKPTLWQTKNRGNLTLKTHVNKGSQAGRAPMCASVPTAKVASPILRSGFYVSVSTKP